MMPEASRSRDPSPAQDGLLGLLLAGNPRRDPSWKRSRHEFVLEYGWCYEPSPLPKGIKKGPSGKCFENAFNLALSDKSLVYCEGFFLDTGGRRLVHHAWVTNGAGWAIDNTLDKPASAYAGVPFGTNFVNLYHLRNEAIICLLDDYLHGWPILHELGDRPED